MVGRGSEDDLYVAEGVGRLDVGLESGRVVVVAARREDAEHGGALVHHVRRAEVLVGEVARALRGRLSVAGLHIFSFAAVRIPITRDAWPRRVSVDVVFEARGQI